MDYQPLIERWQADDALARWAQVLPEQLAANLSHQRYGDLAGWLEALANLPDLPVQSRVLDQARAAVPVLKTAPVIQRWAGLRPRARSRAPMLGAWPGRPGHYIANGGFKIGFGVVTEVARVMADLVMQGIDRIPEGFRVEENL